MPYSHCYACNVGSLTSRRFQEHCTRQGSNLVTLLVMFTLRRALFKTRKPVFSLKLRSHPIRCILHGFNN